MSVKAKRGAEDWVIDGCSYGLLILLLALIILPFMQVVTISLSPASVVNADGFHLFPTKIDLVGYKEIFKNDNFWHSYLVTIARTLFGTAACVLVTVLTAYPLSKANLPYRRGLMLFVVFTMYFGGGMIPKYLLIKGLGLLNSFMVYILPELVAAFALIITRNFFMEIPPALEESAKIDGASDMRVLFSIYLPLSAPVLATISLWYGVDHWNAWMDNLLYVSNKSLFVLQYVLQTILISGKINLQEMSSETVVHTETMKMAALLLSLIPIMCSYPFLQKYFVKGMLVGAVKA